MTSIILSLCYIDSCLDEAAELVVLPSFRGLISDINISGKLMHAHLLPLPFKNIGSRSW